MKKTSILFVFLFLGGILWSQEEPQTAPIPDIPAQRVPAAGDSDYVYPYLDIHAEFPGGTAELLKFIKANIQYPKIAVKQQLEGKCFLQFIVEKDGTVSSFKVIRGVPDCPECDAEALRVVGIMPKWKPGEVDGNPVRSNFNLPIMFKL
ncbi:MAG: energy transducer TonB [Bacteroidota bacterium]